MGPHMTNFKSIDIRALEEITGGNKTKTPTLAETRRGIAAEVYQNKWGRVFPGTREYGPVEY
jgi:hypothetical protein